MATCPRSATRAAAGSQLFKKIHGQYIPKLPFDGNVLYGMAAAYTFVQAMFKAGRNPTRQDLVNAINGGLPQGPSVAPYAYSATDHNGITGAYIGVIKNGALSPARPGPGHWHQPDRCDHDGTRRRSRRRPASGIPSP